MFNVGVKDLVLEPPTQKKLDRPINRNLDEFKIDPLKFEDVSSSKGPVLAEDSLLKVTGKTEPDPNQSQLFTEQGAFPPKKINKLIRLEPIIDTAVKPATKAMVGSDSKSASVPDDASTRPTFEQPPESVPVAMTPENASGGDFVASTTATAAMTKALPSATRTAGSNHNDFATAEIQPPVNDVVSSPSTAELACFVSSQMEQLVPPFANHPDEVSSEPVTSTFVAHAAYSEPRLTWQNQLRQTIEVFEDEIDQAPVSADTEKLKTGLTMLRALETDFGIQATQGDDPESELKEYWSHQIQAINELLKYSSASDDSRPSASLALEHLHLAVNELAAVAKLKLAFAAFCTKVTGFGQYTPFEHSEFDSDQSVLVYCEIENFAPLLETKDGMTNYQTQLSSSFWITNDVDAIVQQQDYPAVTDNARNLRRDFFMHLPVTFAKLPGGKYFLHIKVRDHGSGKTATLDQAMEFSIR